MTNSSKNNIVGKADAMQDVFKAIGKISKTDITVLYVVNLVQERN